MRAQWPEHDPDSECTAIAGTQYGVIHRNQALEAGLSTHAIKRRLGNGRWKRIMPSVYLIAGASVSWMTKAMAATLWAGPTAALSHRAAAHLWNFDGFGPCVIELSAPCRLRSPDATVHETGSLRNKDTALRYGIHVTSIHRTLIDLGDVCPPETVEDALDGALRRHLTSLEWLLSELDHLGTHGRKGASTLKHLLDEGDVRPSWLERRLIRLLKRTELPPFTREHGALNRYWIDFAWPGIKLGVEVHGEKWHRRRRWPRDMARHNELTAAGWTILHFIWPQIRDEPEIVISEIVSTYRRLAGFGI